MGLGWKSNGFTPRKRAIALEALAGGASVAEAARAAQVSPTTIYNCEKRDKEFASLCRAARARAGAGSLDTLAWQHGVTGVEEDVIQGGKVVGRRLKRSDAVFKMILEGRGSGAYGPAVRALREKIEKELRPRIEAEVRAEIRAQRPSAREMRERLDAKLADFNRRMGGDG
jgi:Helix-turn-helix domain